MSHAPHAHADADPGPRDLSVNQPGRDGHQRADDLRAERRALPWWSRLTADRTEERRWRSVADGKAHVARGLERLGADWHLLHGVPGEPGACDIDHLLIGPGGVFAVNSSHQGNQAVCLGGDTLIVDGKRVHHVRHSQNEAAWASRVLTHAVGFAVPVRGLVVIVGDNKFDVRQQPVDGSVHVSTPRGAVRWVRRQSTEWTSYGVDRIYDFARQAASWQEPIIEAATDPVGAEVEDASDVRAAS